jgi:hypothetical protein
MIPVGAALLALALPATAAAKLPSFPSKSIVIKQSIGGISLGQSLKRAKSTWGTTKECTFDKGFGSCNFDGGASGNAQWTAVDGKVVSVQIGAGLDGISPNFKGSVASVKTSKGIGIGATAKAVKQAYPTGKGSKDYWSIGGEPRKAFTTFIFNKGRVSLITTGDGKHQG